MSLIPNSSETDALGWRPSRPTIPKLRFLTCWETQSVVNSRVGDETQQIEPFWSASKFLAISKIHYFLYAKNSAVSDTPLSSAKKQEDASSLCRSSSLCSTVIQVKWFPSWPGRCFAQGHFCRDIYWLLLVIGPLTLFYAKKENILRLIHIKRRTLSQQNCKKIGDQCTKDSLWGLDYRHLIKRERHCLSKTPIDPYILSIPHTLLHC